MECNPDDLLIFSSPPPPPPSLLRKATMCSTDEALTTTESSCKNDGAKHQRSWLQLLHEMWEICLSKFWLKRGRGLKWKQPKRSEQTCSFSGRTKRKLNSNNNMMATAVNPCTIRLQVLLLLNPCVIVCYISESRGYRERCPGKSWDYCNGNLMCVIQTQS